jgi:hypothetical protein
MWSFLVDFFSGREDVDDVYCSFVLYVVIRFGGSFAAFLPAVGGLRCFRQCWSLITRFLGVL